MLFAILLSSGCSHTDANGVRSHLIIGFGVVRVTNTNAAAGTILNVKAIGLYTGGRSLSLGYVDQTRVEIKTNANVLLEIKK
jgi:hypothetical protein